MRAAARRGESSTGAPGGLAACRHRGAVAADGVTGDGAGVLLPLPRALTCPRGRARDGSSCAIRARARIVEEACRAEGLEPFGWREVPDRRRRRSAPTATATHAEDRAARCLAPLRRAATRSCARYRARRRSSARPRRLRRLALVPHGHLQGALRGRRSSRPSTPTCATRRRRRRSAIFHQRFSTNTEPSWERAQPFRLLCHNGEINTIDGNVNWMRARDAARCGARRGLRSRRRLRLRRCSTTRSSCSCAAAATSRHALTMLIPPAWQDDAELERAGARLPPLPRQADRAVGRAGGARLHRRRDRRRRARPQRPAAASLRRRRDGLVVLRVRGGRRSTLPAGVGVAARPARARARCSSSTPSVASRTTAQIKRALARSQPYGRWLDESRGAWRRRSSRSRAPEETWRHGTFSSATRARSYR